MKRIVFLTGAGMSAESGISTFRDAGGLWEKYKIDDVATPEAWIKNPSLVLEFYNERRKQAIEAQPNDGHLAIAKLENQYDVQIITQNVDDLHERAGSKNILHLHGELLKVRSTGPTSDVYRLSKDNYIIQLGDNCPKGYQLRPHIVWFGEDVPEIINAAIIAQSADIFVIVGTSMQVYPAAGLIHKLEPSTPIYVIDPNEITNLPPNVRCIRKGASEGMKELIKILSKE